ncbi:MAG: DUF1499 domain-containing protein [Pseudomonadota bacterium]|nr:DUF1499 domain-containing protein [Pseudomonadota bacterium]
MSSNLSNDTQGAAGRPVTPLGRGLSRMIPLALGLAVLAVLAMVLPGPLYRLGAVGLGAAFRLIRDGAYGGMAAVALGVLALLLCALTRASIRPIALALLTVVLGAVAWGIPYLWLKKAESVPAIHDITTDTRNPPQFLPDVIALRTAAHAANSTVYGGPKVAALQHQAYPDIRPMLFPQPPATVFAAALSTVKHMGWTLDSAHPHAGIIEASSTTLWFGFTDDVVIRIEAQPDGARLDIRSESRIGESDVGRNAARIRRFRAMLYRKLGLPVPKTP